MKPLRSLIVALASTLTFSNLHAGETTPDANDKPAEPRFKISGWIDSGATFNPDDPNDRQNFGRLFDDRSNEPMLNQVVVSFDRALAPEPGKFDWGFRAQFMYGSDARVIHSLGILDRTTDNILQPDVVEAYLLLHFPIFTEGGLDLKAGKFVTLEGAETIDPRTNFFYSHTYIFNFGIPFNHTGALATLHVNKALDLIGGVTRGVNIGTDDNNDSLAFHGGLALTLNEGKFVVAASTHIGPETPHNDHDLRYLNAITTTWKISDKLTSITDLNYALDEVIGAQAYGVAQYFTYAVNSWLSAGVRGEIFRDEDGFYVVSFADNRDAMRALRGNPTIDPRTVGGGKTTYGAITAGVNIKPPMPKLLTGLTIRPEVRYDRALTDTRPFNDSRDRDMITFGLDAILTF